LRFDFIGDDCLGKLTKSIEIEASPEEVFAFINDDKKMNEASKPTIKQEWTSEGPVGVGSTMHFVGAAGGKWDAEITEFVKNKKTASHTIGKGDMKITQSWTLEPTAKGTKLTFFADYELPYSLLGKIVDKVRVSKVIEKSTIQMLENTKKALEA
jgi:carbon monoxide dehydrogenase subunit G